MQKSSGVVMFIGKQQIMIKEEEDEKNQELNFQANEDDEDEGQNCHLLQSSICSGNCCTSSTLTRVVSCSLQVSLEKKAEMSLPLLLCHHQQVFLGLKRTRVMRDVTTVITREKDIQNNHHLRVKNEREECEGRMRGRKEAKHSHITGQKERNWTKGDKRLFIERGFHLQSLSPSLLFS